MGQVMTTAEALRYVRELHAEAVSSGQLPAEVAEFSARATEAAISRRPRRRTRCSVRAYFTKVAERRLIRHHGGTPAAARLVADCVIADLVGSGRTPFEAYEELERGWRTKLPEGLLSEYRSRLCA